MTSSYRRLAPLFLLIFLALVAGSPLLAYPVSITINVTFSEISGQPDPLGLGTTGTTTAIITTTLESAAASGSSATYPAVVKLSIPSVPLLNNITQSGTLTITTNGHITANFSDGTNSFAASVTIPGLTLPTPSPSSFGTKSFSAPVSNVSYSVLGSVGEVGVTGTISAVGLTASPLGGISASATQNGTPPTPQQITVSSNDPAHAALAYSATVSPSSATWLTLSGAGTTPGTVSASFSTSLAPGTYLASVLINTTSDTTGAPLSIPVTYVVQGSGGGGSQLQVSPPSVTFNFFLPTSVSGTQTIAVTSSGPAAGYTASVVGASFVTVSPLSGTTPGSIVISANGSTLSNGTYHATVQLASTLGNITIPVTIIVAGGSGGGGGTSPITIAPSTVTFNYVPGQVTPAQSVKLTSVSPVSFSLGNVALYLPITPLSGTTPATLSVPLNPSTLSPGTHTDYISVQSGGTYAQLTVIVNYASVTLATSTSGLAYAYPGTATSPLTQTLTVTETGSSAAVPLVFTPSVPWLTVSPANPQSGDVISITANPNGLTEGSLTGSLTISSPLGLNELTIPVTFTLNAAPPGVVSVSPPAMAFAYQISSTLPASQTLTVSTLPANSAYTLSAFGASWLSVTSDGVVSVNPQGLIPGVYTGSVKIGGTNYVNAPYFIPVTLTISYSPTFGVSPATLTFNYQPNGAAPAPQVIAVSSSVNNTINASANVPWISISPASASTPADFTITAIPGTLANAAYQGKITFTGGGALSQTLNVPVTLNIAAVTTPVLNAVTNGMTYLNSTGTAGGIIALWGLGLGPTPGVPLELTDPTTIGTSAGGTQVLANGIPCPILFSSNQQVNAILPFSLAGQTSTQIVVTYQGISSNAIIIPIAPSAPGLFALDGTGQNGGATLNSDLSVNTAANPAPAGSIVVLFGGGAGQTNPAGSDGLIVPGISPFPAPVGAVTATVAGQPAQILYAGDAPDLVSGVLQVNLIIPAGTPSGPQPVVITVGGASSQPNLFVYVK